MVFIQETLIYDKRTKWFGIRYDLTTYYDGLYCGDCLDILVDERWVSTRVETSDKWYLVGVDTEDIVGLGVRTQQTREQLLLIHTERRHIIQSLRRGSIFSAYLGPITGSEQGGLYPVAIIRNGIGNYYSDTTVVVIVTRASHREPGLPTHVFTKSRMDLEFDSVIMARQTRAIDNIGLKSYVGNLDECELFLLDKAIKVSL